MTKYHQTIFAIFASYAFLAVGCNDADFAGTQPSKTNLTKNGDGDANKKDPRIPDGWGDGSGDSYVDVDGDGIDDITGATIPLGPDGKPIAPGGGGIGDISGSNTLKFVALKVAYDGERAGDDSQFAYYIRRVSNPKQYVLNKNSEIIKSAKQTFREGSLADICVCGQNTQVELYWAHISGSPYAKGALHARREGEWIVSKQAPDSWKGKVKRFPANSYTVYMGADLENPSFLSNPIGLGQFRTVSFHPNSPFDASRSWDTRDDMRFAYTCDVNACPAELRGGTSLEFMMDPSMKP